MARRRRFFQFSVRTLLVGVALIAGMCAVLVGIWNWTAAPLFHGYEESGLGINWRPRPLRGIYDRRGGFAFCDAERNMIVVIRTHDPRAEGLYAYHATRESATLLYTPHEIRVQRSPDRMLVYEDDREVSRQPLKPGDAKRLHLFVYGKGSPIGDDLPYGEVKDVSATVSDAIGVLPE
jgi:hypothetical protein